MFRKFLHGLAFGAGFTVASVMVLYAYAYLSTAGLSNWNHVNEVPIQPTIQGPPDITTSKQFLGASGSYSGDFMDSAQQTLAGGPGRIDGTATADGKPVVGLRLRLALNGSVYSQWAETDEQGRYQVAVPYGEYRIDGYSLDHRSANRVLAGLIGDPLQGISRSAFMVAADEPGRGLSFRFVTPVKMHVGKRRFAQDEPVVITWDAYPGASQYRLDIAERTAPDDWRSTRLFAFGQQPMTLDTRADLRDLGARLKPGKFYAVHIQALDDQLRILSETPRLGRGVTFEIIP